MVIGDLIVVLLITAALIVAVVALLRGGSPKPSKELWYTVLAAATALLLRFIVSFVPERYSGKVPTEVLLAVAAGAIASAFLLWLGRPQRELFETSIYETSWIFRDDPQGQLVLTYRSLHDRTNVTRKSMLGWRKAAFEPYLWAAGVKVTKLQCAGSEAAFTSANPTTPPQDIPHHIAGYVVELDETDARHVVARLEPGAQKWFLLEAQIAVPLPYWDIAVGTTTLGRPPKFSMSDETKARNLVFVIAGPNRQYTTNLDDQGRRNGDAVTFVSDEVPRGDTRAQVYWYPANTLAPGVANLLKQRFARATSQS